MKPRPLNKPLTHPFYAHGLTPVHSESVGVRDVSMRHKLPAFDVLVDMARNDPQRLENLIPKNFTDWAVSGSS